MPTVLGKLVVLFALTEQRDSNYLFLHHFHTLSYDLLLNKTSIQEKMDVSTAPLENQPLKIPEKTSSLPCKDRVIVIGLDQETVEVQNEESTAPVCKWLNRRFHQRS